MGIEEFVEVDDGNGGKISIPSHLIMDNGSFCLGTRIIPEFRDTTISTGHYVSPNGYVYASKEDYSDQNPSN